MQVLKLPPSARGWGDPYFRGFDGRRFEYQERGWTEMLGSARSSFSVAARLEPWSRPKTTVMRAFNVTLDSFFMFVELLPPSAPWVFVNGRRVSAPGLTVRGVRVEIFAAQPGLDGRVVVEKPGFVRFAVEHPWPASRAQPADFLNFNVSVVPTLKPPVTGLLAPSYTRVVTSLGAAAASANVLDATGAVL